MTLKQLSVSSGIVLLTTACLKLLKHSTVTKQTPKGVFYSIATLNRNNTMTKETNNNEAQATEKMQNVKDWLLAGVFTVTLGAVLAALFYYLEDLIAGLFIITVFSGIVLLTTACLKLLKN